MYSKDSTEVLITGSAGELLIQKPISVTNHTVHKIGQGTKLLLSHAKL